MPQLGIAAMHEAMQRLFNRPEVSLNQQYRKKHELGHALLLFLARHLHKQTSQTIRVHKLQGETCQALQEVFGNKISILGRQFDFTAGEASIGEKNEQAFIDEHPKESSLFLLAGIAATFQDKQYHKYYLSILNNCLAKPDAATWTDFTEPYNYITKRFHEIHRRQPTTKEMSSVFMKVIQAMSELLGSQNSAAALTLLENQLHSNPAGCIENEKIEQVFKENQISEEELRKTILELDIDQIVSKSAG